MRTQTQINEIVRLLLAEYPEANCTLDYAKPHELLFSVRLAAQCTDERVNQVTPALFARFPTLEAFAEADVSEVEQYVHSCGFFRAKARDIVECSKVLLEKYNGQVPSTMEELVSLPGVGRKTANLILGDVFHIPGSTVVDTHCIRICVRLGFYPEGKKDPLMTEKVMDCYIERGEQSDFCHRIVNFGRDRCMAQSPKCDGCPVSDLCDRYARDNER